MPVLQRLLRLVSWFFGRLHFKATWKSARRLVRGKNPYLILEERKTGWFRRG